jgi:hypothetical protein
MSVLISFKVPGDVAVFEAALSTRADEFDAISARSKQQGAIHHRFGIGQDFVFVIDEWESAEQFEAFFGDPALQAFIGEIGASGPPEMMTVSEAISSSSDF